jgi:DNA-binding transcriptional ArsR family regulator
MRRLNPAELFRVLSVDSRIKILEILKMHGPLGTNHIAAMLGITPAAVSQHLKIMRGVGIVISERDGYWIPHMIDESAMEGCRQLLDHICQCRISKEEYIEKANRKSKESIEILKSYKKSLEEELKAVEDKIRSLKS